MRKLSSYFQNPKIHIIFLSIIFFLNCFTTGLNLEFRNKLDNNNNNYRTLQFSSSKKAVSHLLTPQNGLIIVDKPKIRILNYRVKNVDPETITDELSCTSGLRIGSIGSCDELIEIGNAAQRLGQEEGEIAEWLIPPNVTQITIECTSKSGPVEWDYDGKGIFPDIDIDNTRHTGDFWTETTYTHVSKFMIKKVSDQLTGTFTCRNANKPSISNSFYMFVPQPKLEIYNRDQLLQISPPKHADEVIIPCRVNSKDKSVYLYKRMSDGALRKVNLNDEVTFNPYVGFQMRISRDTFGHYVCKVDKEVEEESLRRKRDAPVFIKPLPTIETSTSPGISAFPTSEEIAELALQEAEKRPLETINENPTEYLHQSPQPIYMDARPPNRPKRRRRIKRPFMRRRPGPGPNNNNNNNMFQQRVGLPIGPVHGPPPPPMSHRRPGPFIHFRKRPIPNMHHGPFPIHHHHSRRPLPQFHNHDQNHEHFIQIETPISFVSQPERQSVEESQVFDKEPSQSGSGEKSYLYPSPIISFPPPLVKPVRVLPTFITKSGQTLRPSSSEEKSSEFKYPSYGGFPSNKFSGSEDRPYNKNNSGSLNVPSSKPPRRGAAAILSQNLLPQTMNIMNSMSCVLKKVIMGADVPCNGSFFEPGALRRRPNPMSFELASSTNSKDQETILEVDVIRAPDNKFFPKENVLYTTVPFFVKWQTKYTDYADWAEVNHTLQDGTYKRHKSGVFEDGVNSFEVFNLAEGESGKIFVAYMGDKKEILVHTWKYFIINSTVYNAKGLKHTEDDKSNVFTCRSTSNNKPTITLTSLSEDGCPIKTEKKGAKFSKKKNYIEEDCGLGCVILKTEVSNGIVSCIGDGIDEKIRFPPDVYCTGRPFFIEREKSINMTIQEKQEKLNLPCIINNPNADVYLFHEPLNETVEDVTDHATYDLKTGFSLDLTKVNEALGTYVCTSSTNLLDDTDMVTYYISPEPAYVFHPPEEKVYGSLPLKFSWESSEELEVENKTSVNFYSGVFAKPEGNRQYVGTLEITQPGEESGKIVVIRSSDKKVVHTWHYQVSTSVAENSRLWLDKKKNVFRCKSSSEETPTLFAIECSNPNVCKFKKQFIEHEESHRDNSECGEGCAQLKIWGNKPTGFVKCRGDGVNETLNYFLSSHNSTLLTEKDNLEVFKTPEIVNVVRKLRIGETTNFVCRASKYFYSKGFQWAIETRNGSKRFVDLKIKDDNSYLNEIRSEISLKVGDQDWKAVWCFAPLISSNQWGNVSQPIYIKL